MRILRIIIIPLCLLILGFTLIYVPYPASWQQAHTWQILVIFLPLLILLTFLVDLFLNYLPRSFIIGLGLMVIMVLQALNILNIWLVIEILAVSTLAARLFPKIKINNIKDIPKLRLSKQDNRSTLTKFKRRHK